MKPSILLSLKKYSEEAAKELVEIISKAANDVEEDANNGTFKVVMTKEIIDRDGETIMIDGLDIKNFRKNPVLLFGHGFRSIPIGKVTKIRRVDDEIIAEGVFASTDTAQEVRTVYDEGILKTVSIGFMIKERDPEDPKIITKSELLELSFVPVPSNVGAMTTEKQAKFQEFIDKYDEKRAVPKHTAPKADRDLKWDGSAATKRLRKWASSDGSGDKDKVDFDKYAIGFTWFDSEEKESFSSYKLPHQDIIDGKLKTVWRGVIAAMGALLGARGGVDIPDAERKAVYKHLAAHYEQFDEDPPDFSSYDDAELKALFPELYHKATEDGCKHCAEAKAGRVLSAKNRAKIQSAIKALTDLLELTEKPKKERQAVAINNTKVLQALQKGLEEAIKGSKLLSK